MTHRIVVQRGSEATRGSQAPTYAYSVGPGHEARSHQPFLDGCRVLLARGVAPADTAVMAWSDGVESLRGPVGKAAKLRVGDDAGGAPRFRPWSELAGRGLD